MGREDPPPTGTRLSTDVIETFSYASRVWVSLLIARRIIAGGALGRLPACMGPDGAWDSRVWLQENGNFIFARCGCRNRSCRRNFSCFAVCGRRIGLAGRPLMRVHGVSAAMLQVGCFMA
jgi:hypothetical protein